MTCPTEYELRVVRGSLHGFGWQVQGYDITAYQTGECQIRADYTSSDVLATLPVQILGQVVSIAIPAVTSTAWAFSQAVFGVEIIRDDGERLRVAQGRMLIDTEVVR